jgi:ribosome-binding protein aMBF1 (putative translation factor)
MRQEVSDLERRNFKILCRGRGLSYMQLSPLVGINNSVLARYAKCKAGLSTAAASRLADFFGVSVQEVDKVEESETARC